MKFWILAVASVLGFTTQLTTQTASAKALYMTVRRDFSPLESPNIEINYAQTDPIYLRVLSPKDQKAFIAGQIDLRRAWREPKSQFNPAYFLLNGHNSSQFEMDWLRYGVDFNTRKELGSVAGGAYAETAPAKIEKGQVKFITAPEGFTLVKEVVIYPEIEDKNRPFDVPGFNDYFSYQGALKTKIVNLPKLSPGFYVVQTLQGNLEGQVVVVVNDIQAQLQVSNSTLLYRVANRSGKSMEGASLEIRNVAGNWIKKGLTDSNGELEFKDVSDTDLISLITSKTSTAIIDSEYFSTVASFPDLYLYSDRPMYRKGEKVHFRGILRDLVSGVGSTKNSIKKVVVGLEGLDGVKTSNEITAKVGEFGTFQGELTISDKQEGLLRLVAKLDKIEHSGEIRVKDYVKPLFFIKIHSDQENLKAGDELRAQIKVERYAGGSPTISKAHAQLYRVRMSSPQWIEDAGAGEAGSTVTYGFEGDNKGSSSLLPVLVTELEEIEFDSNGKADLKLQIPAKLSGPENYDYQFLLKITLVDTDDNLVVSSKQFFDLAADVVAQARFDRLVANNPEESKLLVRSVSASGKPIADTKGVVEFTLLSAGSKKGSIESKEIRTDSQGRAAVTLPQSLNGKMGELLANVKLFDKAKRSSVTDCSLVLAGNQKGAAILDVQEIKVLTNKSELTSRDKIQLFVMLPHGWGINGEDQGQLYLTLASDKIHSRKVLKVKGNSLWIEEPLDPIYGTGIYISLSYPQKDEGWIERRSSFRIIDTAKQLKVSIRPDSPLTSPGGEQGLSFSVFDNLGKPVRAELSVSVVDKAVLDLQPEIRPALLDFFYPLAKLNLMSFYSSQFQGYGYGEELARLFSPNFSMAAAKAESKIMDQKDTAYWNGLVMTDEKGQAKVKFTLPGNQTIWKVTAVVVDKAGRFGEGLGEFKAQAQVSVVLGFPSFMRKSDSAKLRVNLSNVQATESLPIVYKLIPEGVGSGGDSDGIKFDKSFEIRQDLAPRAQVSRSVVMTAGANAKINKVHGVIGELKFGNRKLNYRDTLKIQSDAVTLPEYIYPEKNLFRFKLAKNERAQDAHIFVTTGLAGVIAPTMEWLIRYPYGCVEQTLNTTLPNLMVSNWLESSVRSGLKLNAMESSLLNQAKDFGASGISRLKSFQQKEGGFKWFVGDSESADVNMSLLVMASLSTANISGINLYEFRPTYEFLKKQNFIPASPQGIFFSYIESKLNRFIYVNREKMGPNLKLQTGYVIEKGSLLEKALLLSVLTAHYSTAQQGTDTLGTEKSNLAQNILKEIQPVLQGGNYQKLHWGPGQEWPAYPGHWIATLAAVSNALKAAIPEAHEKIKAAVKMQIMSQFNGGHFGSTYDDAMVFLSLPYFLDEELVALKASNGSSKSFPLNVNLSAKLNGKSLSLGDLHQVDSLGGMQLDIPISDLNRNKSADLELQIPANLVARGVLNKSLPLSSVVSQDRGWQINRNYYSIDNSGKRTLLDPSKSRLKVGELVYAEIKFVKQKENGNYWRSRYYMLTDEIPAGLVPVQEDKEYRGGPFNLALSGNYRMREISNERVRWYFDFSKGWMDRIDTVGVVLRAQYAGSFESGVTRMDDFYDETQTSFSPSVRFNIDSVDGI